MPLHPGESNWRFVPCGPILQDENGRTTEIGGWALPRQKIIDHLFLTLNVRAMGLLSGLVAKTPHSQYRGTGFDPWSGN